MQASAGENDTFELRQSPAGKIELCGTTGVALAKGLYWYLRKYCSMTVTWGQNGTGDNLVMPSVLPAVRFRRSHLFSASHHFKLILLIAHLYSLVQVDLSFCAGCASSCGRNPLLLLSYLCVVDCTSMASSKIKIYYKLSKNTEF